ncbi:DUF3006 domain-containing protein [Clostridium oceanicum]|uniref:DUF3006 domain-containing protein n=1 Tax=Clostridium oceanicum TaxID=1543 RepID=A0ABN1JS55_9CLOT
MKGIVDRIEGNIVVLELENKTMLNINIRKFPKELKEGDYVYKDKISGKMKIDKEMTKKISEEIKKLTKDIWDD